MENLLNLWRNNPIILLLTIQTIIWIGLQAAQIELQNQFQAEEIRQKLITNWNQTPIIEFNISKECLETETAVNYTIPYENLQCLCQEAIYDQDCSQDQQERQGCQQIQEFNPQNINYWPFYLRLTIQVPYKLCQKLSNLNTYYNQLKENKCFNNSYQDGTQQAISNIQKNSTYMAYEQILVKDSIQIERSLNDPIVGIYIGIQTQNNFEKSTIIEALRAQDVWNVNNISQYYHPHIYNNVTYQLVAEKYIKLKDQCDCSNQVLNTLDQLIELEQKIGWMPYLQLGFILIQILIILLFYNFNKGYILSTTLIFLPELVILLIYYLNYHQNTMQLVDCFDFSIMNDSLSLKLLSIQITILIIVPPYIYAILYQIREYQKKLKYQISKKKVFPNVFTDPEPSTIIYNTQKEMSQQNQFQDDND